MSSSRNPSLKRSAWIWPRSHAHIQKQGHRARIVPDVDGIVQLVAPEMRFGDVVAILSNGGFGGIYEKLPQRLRAINGERFSRHFGGGRGQSADLAKAGARPSCLRRQRFLFCSNRGSEISMHCACAIQLPIWSTSESHFRLALTIANCKCPCGMLFIRFATSRNM